MYRGLGIDGVQFGGGSGNLAESNDIGTDPTGTIALANGQGVGIRDGSTDDTIGGRTPGYAISSRATVRASTSRWR